MVKNIEHPKLTFSSPKKATKIPVTFKGGGGGRGVERATVGSESSDKAFSHNVQFFRGLFHFQW